MYITGVSGFVGSHLVNYFQNKDYIIYGNSRQSKSELTGVKLVSDYAASTLRELRVNSFIHLAGIAHDLSGSYKPEDYYTVNLEGTKKAVHEFLQSDAIHFIFVSSIKAACDTATVPAEEAMPTTPQTDYGKSKRLAEEYILSLPWPADKKYYILRPCMMHGTGNKGNLNTLYKYTKIGLPFLFGSFRNQRSFHSIENFSYVAEQLITSDIPSGIYHLADDGYLSTTELYELMCHTLKIKQRVWNIPAKWIRLVASLAGKQKMISKLTENMMVSNQKIKSVLPSPLPVGLKEGLIKTINSFDGK